MIEHKEFIFKANFTSKENSSSSYKYLDSS